MHTLNTSEKEKKGKPSFNPEKKTKSILYIQKKKEEGKNFWKKGGGRKKGYSRCPSMFSWGDDSSSTGEKEKRKGSRSVPGRSWGYQKVEQLRPHVQRRPTYF